MLLAPSVVPNPIESHYLRAIRELALVRKIRQPTVQVNIGERQINVAG